MPSRNLLDGFERLISRRATTTGTVEFLSLDPSEDATELCLAGLPGQNAPRVKCPLQDHVASYWLAGPPAPPSPSQYLSPKQWK
jgi:hypothetical protein